MLSKVDNDLLTQTDRGTPMGEYLRRYWHPVMLAEEVPEPDCPPKRVRILGEDLVGYRDTSGDIGLIDNYCPHRRASMFFARNEECGLRCVYHGWKFDKDGNCVDMPSEPAESNFKDKVRITAYPAREYGGLIWAYLGPLELMPNLPELEWARVPADQRILSKRLQLSNYSQAVEGGIDSSHVSFLHSILEQDKQDDLAASGVTLQEFMTADKSPRFFVKDADPGLLIAARRNAGEENYYWRITQFLLPYFTMIPGTPGYPIGGHCWVPIDDENCYNYSVTWHPSRAFTEDELKFHLSGLGIHADVDDKYVPLRNKSNDYVMDRDIQRTTTFSGIRGIGEQDMAVQESMGAIVERPREHLGSSDAAVIAMRRRLIREARNLEEGIEPFAPSHSDAYKVRSAAVVLARDIPFHEGAQEELKSMP